MRKKIETPLTKDIVYNKRKKLNFAPYNIYFSLNIVNIYNIRHPTS